MPRHNTPLAHHLPVQPPVRPHASLPAPQVKVVMLHFITIDPWDQPLLDADGMPAIHLVEVYELAGGLRPDQLKLLLGGLLAAVLAVLAAAAAVQGGFHAWQPHMHIGQVLRTGELK